MRQGESNPLIEGTVDETVPFLLARPLLVANCGVWGIIFLLIIGIPFFLCYLILMFTVLSENIGTTF